MFCPHVPFCVSDKPSLLLLLLEAMMEADRDREMVDVIVKKIEAEEKAEQEQYLRSRYDAISQVGKFRCPTVCGECMLEGQP